MTGPEIGISPKRDFPQVHFKFYLQKNISTHLYFPQRFAGCGRGGRGPGGEAEKHHLREKKGKFQIRGPFFDLFRIDIIREIGPRLSHLLLLVLVHREELLLLSVE